MTDREPSWRFIALLVVLVLVAFALQPVLALMTWTRSLRLGSRLRVVSE
jgi:hypothetical protein